VLLESASEKTTNQNEACTARTEEGEKEEEGGREEIGGETAQGNDTTSLQRPLHLPKSLDPGDGRERLPCCTVVSPPAMQQVRRGKAPGLGREATRRVVGAWSQQKEIFSGVKPFC